MEAYVLDYIRFEIIARCLYAFSEALYALAQRVEGDSAYEPAPHDVEVWANERNH